MAPAPITPEQRDRARWAALDDAEAALAAIADALGRGDIGEVRRHARDVAGAVRIIDDPESGGIDR